MAKLTLSVEDEVVVRAKRYAKRHGVSVSKLVENYLATVATPARSQTPDTPILRSLRGLLKRGSRDDYRKHLEAKYL